MSVDWRRVQRRRYVVLRCDMARGKRLVAGVVARPNLSSIFRPWRLPSLPLRVAAWLTLAGAGYIFRITGGNDKQGFPMKQVRLTTPIRQRTRLLRRAATVVRPADAAGTVAGRFGARPCAPAARQGPELLP